MYTLANMQESIKKVEATRAQRMANEPRRMTADEKDALLAAYHPDYKEEGFITLKVGPNKGEKVPTELGYLLESNSRILGVDIDLDKVDYDVDVLVIGAGGAGSSAAIEAHEAGANLFLPRRTGFPGTFLHTAKARRTLHRRKGAFLLSHTCRCTPCYSMVLSTFLPMKNFLLGGGLLLFWPLRLYADTARRQIRGHLRIPHKPSPNLRLPEYSRDFPSVKFRQFSGLCLFPHGHAARN